MKVAIVGAGLAGLAAARTLQASGIYPTVFESSSRIGGRVQTISVNGFTFDLGATSFTPRTHHLANVIEGELAHPSLVRITKPIYLHANGRIQSGDRVKNQMARYSYTAGNEHLPKMLASEIDVCVEHPITSVSREENRVLVDEQAFDRVILTAPIPISLKLLAKSGVRLPSENVYYRPCLSVYLGFDREFDPPYHSLIDPEQRHPLTWISVESSKCPDRAPPGCCALVLQLGPEYSEQHFAAPSADILSESETMARRVLGESLGSVVVSGIERYLFSQPETTASFSSMNHSRDIILAGDGLLGGRTELAYETGVMAARRILEST